MAETVAVHHPAHPGSDMIVSRKAYEVDLAREGYLIGHSDGTVPLTAPTPAAQDGGNRLQVDAYELEALRLQVQAAEERETALALRAVELDDLEADLAERAAELNTREQNLVAREQAATEGKTPTDRNASKAAAERQRRARKAAEAAAATGETDAGQVAASYQEGTT